MSEVSKVSVSKVSKLDLIRNGCANRVESRACSSYPEVKPAIDEVNKE